MADGAMLPAIQILTMKNMKPIAVIPAKGHSDRVPGKNMEEICGYPLFLYSVWYAINEGYRPVVSSDNDTILEIARFYGADTFRENVDDSNMANCVRQVLEAKDGPEEFALLQPTSPLRRPGLLREMTRTVHAGSHTCVYTVNKVKMLGTVVRKDGTQEFHMACRDQDAPAMFYPFDGNLLVTTRSSFTETGSLFNDGDAGLFPQYGDPCSVQVDMPLDVHTVTALLGYHRFHQFNPKNNLPDSYTARFNDPGMTRINMETRPDNGTEGGVE